MPGSEAKEADEADQLDYPERMGRAVSDWLPAVAVTLAVTLASAPSLAERDAVSCADPRVSVDPALPQRWVEPVERACRDLATMHDRDPTARVRISSVGDDLQIAVSLADGRTALRTMRKVGALRPTLEALLSVPPTEAAAFAASASEQVNEPVASSAAAAVPPTARDAGPRDVGSQGVGVEIGGGAGARLAGQGYHSFALSVFAELTIGRWLFGTMFRWDVIEQKSVPTVDVFEMETVAAGLFVGRRIDTGVGSFDLGAAARLLSEAQSYEGHGGEQSRTTTDVRIGTFTRFLLGHGSLRGLVELDAEVSPARIRRDVVLDPLLPAVPAWSAGLTAGLLWGGR